MSKPQRMCLFSFLPPELMITSWGIPAFWSKSSDITIKSGALITYYSLVSCEVHLFYMCLIIAFSWWKSLIYLLFICPYLMATNNDVLVWTWGSITFRHLKNKCDVFTCTKHFFYHSYFTYNVCNFNWFEAIPTICIVKMSCNGVWQQNMK